MRNPLKQGATPMPTRCLHLTTYALLLATLSGDPLRAETSRQTASDSYTVDIVPSDFVPSVTNKFFSLKPGTRYLFKDKTGNERIEVAVTDDKKRIMGVTTSVVRVKEWKRNTLVEETRDWYAQDKTGTVWYFGEAVDNYKDGKLDNHKGSWEAGVDGAVPGIIMLGTPEVGQTYRQEYYKHRAEDMGTIVALDAKVSVPLGKFENCLKVRDWSRIEAGNEHKYYCLAIGFLAMEESIEGGEKLELVEIQRGE
jgi:hypothetical protein